MSPATLIAPPESMQALVDRYDPDAFDTAKRVTRVRLSVTGADEYDWDAVITNGNAVISSPHGHPDAVLCANAATWRKIARDIRRAMDSYRSGHLQVRHNMHIGVGFLAATGSDTGPGRLRFRSISTRGPRLSIVEAGTGPPVLALHGLGATKGSFMTTVVALSDRFRVIAVDQPGFGDSDKPIGAAYDPRFFAGAAIDLLDALEIDRVNLVGNSLGGRVALETGLLHPDRVWRLCLLAPSLAWKRGRPLLPLLRLTRPELGLVQIAPRRVVEAVVRGLIPDAEKGWVAAGVDEFLRAYLTPSGRAAFYAAARHIYIEEPHGQKGFWPRLATLEPDALFVWGRHDRLVPLAFAKHVTETLPKARHLQLPCGHVPQIELPEQTHAAMAAFFRGKRS
jgi:pimeloyl-ACP methyl ester carboxylesterase